MRSKRTTINSNWKILCLRLALTLLFVSALVFAGCGKEKPTDPLTPEERAWLSAHDGHIRLAPDPNARPIDFFDENGEFQGLAADYVRLIEKRLNFRFDIVRCKTWEEAVKKAKKREVDVLCSFTRTKERERWMSFTKPYIKIPTVILTRDDADEDLTLDTLSDMKVTFTRGWIIDDYLRENFTQLKMLPAIDADAALNNLVTKKADAWVTALTVAANKIEEHKITNLRIAGNTDLHFLLSMASRKDWPILNTILNKGLAQISKTEREDIFQKWITLKQKNIFISEKFWFILIVITGGALLPITIIYYWNRTLKNSVEQKTEELAVELKERKRAEEERRDAVMKQHEAVRAGNVGLWDWDLIANKVSYSAEWKRQIGYEEHEIVDDFKEWESRVHPDDLQPTIEKVQRSIKEIHEDYRSEFRFRHRDGSYRWILAQASFVQDETGRPVRMLGSHIDITEKKEMETRLQQSQKMEAIGNLAGGIAHDFNNILSPIIGMAELLLADLPKNSEIYENAQEILNAGKRAGDLVNQILAFSRQSEHKLIPIRIQHILKEVIKLIRSTLPSYIEIIEDIQPDSGLVMADPTQMHQVAMNIITNAYHAVESQGGKITIQLKETDWAAGKAADTFLDPGRYVVLSISDNGQGISSDVMTKIFEPYFTTKEQGKGTGLGLAVAYGIIKEHKGDIRVHSEPGTGTTFSIYLPKMKKYAEAAAIPDPGGYPTGTERILLVDDDQSIANLEKKMLERLGYHVTSRVNSIEALEAFKAMPNHFDLFITDMNMPNMPGDQLAKEIKAIRADIPIIICTGFSERIDNKKAANLGIEAFLMKPIILSELAKTVRKVLDGNKINEAINLLDHTSGAWKRKESPDAITKEVKKEFDNSMKRHKP